MMYLIKETFFRKKKKYASREPGVNLENILYRTEKIFSCEYKNNTRIFFSRKTKDFELNLSLRKIFD